MATKCYAMVRGSVARFTRLDAAGRPVESDRSVVVTSGITSVAIEEISETLANDVLRDEVSGQQRVILRERTEVIGYSADIVLSKVDPDLIEMLTSQPVVLDAQGNVSGNEGLIRLPVASFALEVWSKLATPIDGYTHGYTLFPRLRGGRASGFSFGNNTATFTITGARTTRMSKWGAGPYTLRWDGQTWAKTGWDSTPWETEGWDAEPGGAVRPCLPNRATSSTPEEPSQTGLPVPFGEIVGYFNANTGEVQAEPFADYRLVSPVALSPTRIGLTYGEGASGVQFPLFKWTGPTSPGDEVTISGTMTALPGTTIYLYSWQPTAAIWGWWQTVYSTGQTEAGFHANTDTPPLPTLPVDTFFVYPTNVDPALLSVTHIDDFTLSTSGYDAVDNEPKPYERLGKPVGAGTHWTNFLLDYAPEPLCGAQALYDVIDGGTASSAGADVLDGQYAVTSAHIIDGGRA